MTNIHGNVTPDVTNYLQMSFLLINSEIKKKTLLKMKSAKSSQNQNKNKNKTKQPCSILSFTQLLSRLTNIQISIKATCRQPSVNVESSRSRGQLINLNQFGAWLLAEAFQAVRCFNLSRIQGFRLHMKCVQIQKDIFLMFTLTFSFFRSCLDFLKLFLLLIKICAVLFHVFFLPILNNLNFKLKKGGW